MEVKIGIQMAPRELVVETAASAEDIKQALTAALADNKVFVVTDKQGRHGPRARRQDRLRRARPGRAAPDRLRRLTAPGLALVGLPAGDLPGGTDLLGGADLLGQAESRHPLRVRVGQRGEHPADLAKLRSRAPGEQPGQRLPLRGHPLRLAERLADEAPRP